ncbi:carboxypeptidase family protein [Pseudonocardia sediminis]|uniref:Carboxypeptidase family protein n=1 Tax=Pseudonocardia sediminis TaxID=1397368 RepID=A0A4Q7UPP4_PSEST|nr:carboxypeptidase regulatory-like domain-containing protein [Pseudonocardia sediminis]RZT83692.1 carboxypeptidase family protein [Pseudonocardia sediminis]
MTTLALLGLLVVLLVAIGIAAFLLRGRKRDDESDVSADEPPRTVRDLVNRRRGLAEGTIEDGGVAEDTDAGTIPRGAGSTATDTAVGVPAGTAPAGDVSPDDAPAAPDTVTGAAASSDARTADAADDVPDRDAPSGVVGDPSPSADVTSDPTTPTPGSHVAVADTDATPASAGDAATPIARDLSDVDAGPVGPPWSRGFVDGRPIEPPPSASPRRPRPTPHARSESAATADTSGPAAGEEPSATAGDESADPSSPAPAETTAGTTPVVATAGTAASGIVESGHTTPVAADEPDDADTPVTTATSATTTSATTASATAADVFSGESAAPRPAAPPRQESRSPVDPDLVKRVTAVPTDRSPLSRTTTPDTEREFREARDRITGPGAAGRVPEQGGPVGATVSQRPSPVPVPDRDRADGADPADPDSTTTGGTSGGPVVTGAGIVAGTLGLGAAAAGIAASRGRESSTDDTTPTSGASAGDTSTPVGSTSATPTAGTSTTTGSDVTGPDITGPIVTAPGASGVDVPTAEASGPGASTTATSAAGSSDEDRTAPSPTARTTVPGGPPLGPTGEPAPRPTPRLMRSATPVIGADDDVDPDLDDDPDIDPATSPALSPVLPTVESTTDTPSSTGPVATTPGTDGTISAMTATDTATGTASPTGTTSPAGTASPAGTTSPTDTGEVATSATGPADPVEVEESPVAFRRPRPETAPVTPVPGMIGQDVEVLVTGRDAAPVGGVAVAALDGTGQEITTATTGPDGAATLRVPGAGRYVLVSSAEGYQSGVATCAVADETARVSLTVTRSAAVHGVVRAASGSPMAGVVVTLDQDGETVGRADTGADGAFRIADLGAGYYLLAAGTGAGGASQSLRVAAEADVEQDLQIAR